MRLQQQRSRNPDPAREIREGKKESARLKVRVVEAEFWLGRRRCARIFSALAGITR